MKDYEGSVTVLECDKCTAFFIDEKDFEKHKTSHNDCEEADYEIKTVEYCEWSPTKGHKRKLTHRVGSEKPGWRSSGHQKLRLKLVKTRGKCVEPSNDSFERRSTQRRRSARISFQGYEYSDCAVNAPKRSRKPVEISEKNGPQTKQRRAVKKMVKRETSVIVASEFYGNVRHTIESTKPKKLTELKAAYSATEVDGELIKVMGTDVELAQGRNDAKKPKPRLKRLRRKTEEEDDKSQIVYTCAHCLRNFRRKSNLKRHMSKLHFGQEKEEGGDSSRWFTGYCCDVCGEGLQLRSTMMAHRDVIHRGESEIDWCKYQTSLARVKFCGECKKYFRAGKLFDEHQCDFGKGIGDADMARLLREAEDIKPSFFCHICRSCFRWKWDYRLHKESEHKDAPPVNWSEVRAAFLEFCCEKCSKAYFSDEELKGHSCSAVPQQNASDAVVKPFRCDICGNDYFWKSDFRRHMRTKHPKENFRPTEHDTIIYSCPYCEEKFSMKKRILYHMRKAHSINSDSPFVCVKCNKVFRRRDNLDRHNESYHPALNDTEEANKILNDAEIRINGDVAYHCQMCNRNISNPNRFISHYRGHNSENKFTCDLCGKQAKTQHQLNTHIKNIHLNIRNYKCDICNKSFYTKQACEEHRRIHTGERPFSCEICGKTFVAGNALISHKRFHNDFYPHSCHMCPKKFKVRRSLINHIRTHTGERPFKCDLCNKTFNNSSQYSYHKKVTHSEARPFTCALCGNCFKANKFLSRHMELHAVRSQIQSRKTNNPAHYVTSPMKTVSLESSVPTQQRVSHVEQTVPTVTSLVPPTQPAPVDPMSGYVKESNAVSAYRSDDITNALYGLQRGYESTTTNEYARREECDMNSVNTVKRSFTAADAYMTAANYALTPNEDYKATVSPKTYNTSQPTTGQPISTSGKHMTWL